MFAVHAMFGQGPVREIGPGPEAVSEGPPGGVVIWTPDRRPGRVR
jgi:hypothetical protein